MPDPTPPGMPSTNNPPPTTPAGAPQKPEPVIRTMRSDIAAALQATKPSLVSLLARQAESGAVPGQPGKRNLKTSIAALIALVLLCGALGTIIYYANPPTATTPSSPPPIPERALFFEDEREIVIGEAADELIRGLREAGSTAQATSSLRRIIILTRDAAGAAPQPLALADFFTLIGAAAPQGFTENVAAPPQFFIYRLSSGPSTGFLFEAKNPNRALGQLLSWEPSLPRDLEPLFLGAPPPPSLAPFQDRTYRNIDFRYLALDQVNDRGIGYLFFPAKRLIIIATSEGALRLAVDRLLENR